MRLAYSGNPRKCARLASLLWLRFYSNTVPLCTFRENCKDYPEKQLNTKHASVSIFIQRKQTPGGRLVPGSQTAVKNATFIFLQVSLTP